MNANIMTGMVNKMKASDIISTYNDKVNSIKDIEGSLKVLGHDIDDDKGYKDARKDNRLSVKLLIKEYDKSRDEYRVLMNMEVVQV